METSIYKEYFDTTREYQSKYGKKTVVLMQVGAFFEIYGLVGSQEIAESNIEDVAEICQLNITEKKYVYQHKPVLMSGFRDFTLEKYVARLTEAGYTIPVFVQEKKGKEVIRKLEHIYSIGTFLSCDTDTSPKMTNNIMCIWFETSSSRSPSKKDTLVYGVSVVNIFTGKSSIFQYETSYYLSATTFDELQRYISIFSPSEVLLISSFEKSVLDKIIQFSGIQCDIIHRFNPLENTIVQNASSQKYVKMILTNFFGEEVYEICSEFHTQVVATQSYCYLLHFLKEHNPALVHKIAFPEFTNTSDRMLLANHTLLQLNIIDDRNHMNENKKFTHLSSILSLLNHCGSPMGKRLLQFQLTNPTFNTNWLKTEYSVTTNLLKQSPETFALFRKQITQIRDIEKIARQWILKRIYPATIYHLYKSIQQIRELNHTISQEYPEFHYYLCEPQIREHDMSKQKIENICNHLCDFLNKYFVIDACKTVNSMTTFETNIIQKGVDTLLDETLLKYNQDIEMLNDIHRSLNTFMNQHENPTSTTAATEYIKLHETEKSGYSLQITTKRSQILKTLLEKDSSAKIQILSLEHYHPSILQNIPVSSIKFSKASTQMVEIEIPLLKTLCKEIQTTKEKLNGLMVKVYQDILVAFEKKSSTNISNEHDNIILLEILSNYIAKMDVAFNKAYIAKQYHYCCPTLFSDECSNQKSFVHATELRHALIEQIQENEIYVANDIALGCGGEAADGVLLYGTNAVGKTSLIRALGIAIIMAQSGFYVPCSQFTFKPYTAIFSRILGNDNLFKGLSTFAVEMSELRIILKQADENSLILGDELCSGTEMVSALSIFVSGLMKLHEKKSSFIFATHFHEIAKYDEIKSLKRLSMKHMEVLYDREQDCLVYDRKLKDGSGSSTYGLEVCKSLYLDEEFLELAYMIRNKYYPETRGELAFPTTRYNSKKVRGMCEMCGEKVGEEIHHLQQQKEADMDGFIGSFHKNHPANLISICETCHTGIHQAPASLAQSSMSTPIRKQKKISSLP
jgi:DNA mismatch repair protein MutS